MRDIITAVISAHDPEIMIREPESVELACAKMIDMVARLEGASSPAPAPPARVPTYEIRELERPSENRVKILTSAGWVAAWDENGDRAEEAYAKGARIAGTIQTDNKNRKKIVGVEVVA
tara:strand:- start:73 stop:429 length:357 start_codon:yes stop_codon:yes gene_type:complete